MLQNDGSCSANHRISVVTVSLNDAANLEYTIRSVTQQSYPHIEFIVIDGGSSDHTLDVINTYDARIAYWTSEKDRGLYHAMNKGMKKASGDFLIFINAGDTFSTRTTIENVASMARETTDVLYGNVMLVDASRRSLGLRSETTTQKLPEKLDWKSLKYGMAVCHQGLFVRRSLAPEFVENNLCADLDWAIKVLKKSHVITNVRQPVSNFLVGGISRKLFLRSMCDRFIVLNRHYGTLKNLLNHAYIVARACLHNAHRSLPKPVVEW